MSNTISPFLTFLQLKKYSQVYLFPSQIPSKRFISHMFCPRHWLSAGGTKVVIAHSFSSRCVQAEEGNRHINTSSHHSWQAEG